MLKCNWNLYIINYPDTLRDPVSDFTRPNSVKIRELYKISFPHHFNRLSDFNYLKNQKIISDEGVGKHYQKNETLDMETSLATFRILSSLKSESYSIGNHSKAILLSFYSFTNTDDQFLIKKCSFKYLICIPNQIESSNGEINLEYSRFIIATFGITSKYDYTDHFENDDSGYGDGVLVKKESEYMFKLFDINKPTFYDDEEDEYPILSYKEYNPESVESESNVSVLDLWFNKFNKDYQDDIEYVKEGYVKGLEEFARNTFSFKYYNYNDPFYKLPGFNGKEKSTEIRIPYSYNYGLIFSSVSKVKSLYNSFKNEIENEIENINRRKLNDISSITSIDIKTLLDNITWKNQLYDLVSVMIKCKNKDFKNNLDSIFGFLGSSIILDFSRTYSESYYEPGMIFTIKFKFMVPYDDENDLFIDIVYYEITGQEEKEVDFKIDDRLVNSKVGCCILRDDYVSFNQLYSYELSKERKKVDFDKELVPDKKELENLTFPQFISLLLKKKYPKVSFNLSTILSLASFNPFIDSKSFVTYNI
ncbi:hypothetical protein ACTA71_010805 [Dictyostelium dimigraforme]